MKLGIMQPYFFPYLGYYSIIKNVDKWVVFDTSQYIERGWVNRNRIIHPNKPEDMYITIPLMTHSQTTRIKDIRINDSMDYIQKIRGQLESSYKRRAPNYQAISKLVIDCLEEEQESMSRLAILSLSKVCAYLGIPFDYKVYSEMPERTDSAHEADEWALEISKVLGAQTYINPPGGKSFSNKGKYDAESIELLFQQVDLVPYNQKRASLSKVFQLSML